MAEIKNLFVKSKMNKDLDARLLTNGEYRDAQNVSVSKSEGADVGAVENILGNIELIDFETIVTNAVTAKYTALGFGISTDAINYKNLEVIGQIPNLENNSVVVFLTDWTDTSNDKLSNFPGNAVVTTGETPGSNELVYAGPGCFICYYSFQTGASSILAGGSYLNFSKSHPMLGLDYLEDFLYFTDNRNQPRKINVSTALAQSYTSNTPYYGSEDDISVCKFAPYESIGFIDAGNNSTLISRTEEFLPSNVVMGNSVAVGAGGSTLKLKGDNLGTPVLLNIGVDIAIGGKISVPSLGVEYTITNLSIDTIANTTDVSIAPETFGVAIPEDAIVTASKVNPYYQSAFGGDPDLLKEEFPRYSYRFRYDDGEYSLMAPFSQIAFVPEQYGYFLLGDEQDAGESGIVKFVENRVDQIFLQIPMPSLQSQLSSSYKVSELQILVKNAGENVVRVIEDVLVDNISYSSTTYSYQYDSTQPFKTLPEKDITRVSDKAPVRAASQAIIGNRVVYGNYLDKHTHPISLDFSAKIEDKDTTANDSISKEFPNHTLKQNRTYQLGLVLMDRYGRSSGVITSDNLKTLIGTDKKSSIYAPYTDAKFANGTSSARDWPGNCLGLLMYETIPSSMSEQGYPGLYSYENPLGWYSYKVVVKQTEQEYYNVYVPGAIAGNINWNSNKKVFKLTPGGSQQTGAVIELVDVTDLSLGMTWLGSGETDSGIYIIGINDPSPGEIRLSESIVIEPNSEMEFELIEYPTYVNPYSTSNIVLFGDNINKVPRDLNKVGPTDRIYSSAVRLFNRVNPIYSSPLFYNTQHTFASPLVGDEVVSIRPFRDLGEWTSQTSKYYPVSTSGGRAVVGGSKLQLFYKANDNPFIATLTTNSLIGINPVLDTSTTYTNRNLGVFETEPTTSLLDIFWETSTSGLISDLNTQVDVGNQGPVGFTDINFNLKESDPQGTIVTNYFELVRSDGNLTNDFSQINMSNLTVVDGNQQDRSGDFNLVSNVALPNTQFAIETNNTFYYGSQANTLENYTFTIDCIANGINNTLTIPGPTELSNVTPFVFEDAAFPSASTNVRTLAKIDNDAFATKTWNTDLFSSLFTLPQPYSTQLPNVILDEIPNATVLLLSFVSLNGSARTVDREQEMVVYLESILTKFNGDTVNIGRDESFKMMPFPLTSNKTLYRLFFNPQQVKDYDDQFNVNGRPNYTFKFTLYDMIPGGGPGVTAERLSNGTLFPTPSPAFNPIGNNNLTFSFNVKFEV